MAARWLVCLLTLAAFYGQTPPAFTQPIAATTHAERIQERPDFDLMARQQAETDANWRRASAGRMRMEKISYRSSVGDLDVPAFVFEPLLREGTRRHPALVWVHEDIRGRLYEHYIPYVLEATRQGYVVIAPEYRGSVGYGKAFYDAIDYGGAEVDDVVTAASVLRRSYPHVDPSRIGVIGWSHGGMIALLAIFRNPATFGAAAAIVPVVNLFERLEMKGVERQRRAIDPHNRFGGSPTERPDVYRERSPLFHVDRLQIPLLVHLAANDRDVTIEESMPIVHALRTKKPDLSDVKVYSNPPGGHLFDRRVTPGTWAPDTSREHEDSWARVWAFFSARMSSVREPTAELTGGAAQPAQR